MPSFMFGVPPESEPTTKYDEELLFRRAQHQLEQILRAHEDAAEDEYYRKQIAPSSHTITLRMPTALLERLDALAKDDLTSRSQVLRRITSLFLGDMDENPIKLPAITQDSPLYQLAENIVIKHQCASISLIQRHLRIGYAVAQRLMTELEIGGVVTAPDVNGERFVIIQPNAWEPTTSKPEA